MFLRAVITSSLKYSFPSMRIFETFFPLASTSLAPTAMPGIFEMSSSEEAPIIVL